MLEAYDRRSAARWIPRDRLVVTERTHRDSREHDPDEA